MKHTAGQPAYSRLAMTLVLICLAAALPRIYLGATQYIEYDGYWHVFIAMQDRWANFLQEYRDNFHPPLFYLLLKIPLWFGRSALLYRAISILSGVAAIFLIGRIAARISLWRATPAIAALAFGLALPSIIISCEVRSYMLCVFFVLASLYYLLDLLSPGRHAGSRAGFAASAVLAAYSHYCAFFYVFGAALATAVIGIFSLRREYPRRMLLDLATFVPVAALIVFLYVTHAGPHAVVTGHLKDFSLQSGESVPGFLFRNSRYLFNSFSPVTAGTRPQFIGVLAGLIAAAAAAAYVIRRPRPENARATAIALVGLAILGGTLAGGILGKYPFGGFLRQQYILFPFAVLWVSILLDRAGHGIRNRRLSAALAAAVMLLILGVSAVKFYRFPKVRTEIGTAEVSRFRTAFPSPAAVYVDQYNLILFFIHYHDWTWTFVRTDAAVPAMATYRVSKGKRHFLVVRDWSRWNADLADPALYADLASCMRSQPLPSLTIFHVSEEPRATNETDASIANRVGKLASDADLSATKLSILGNLSTYAELVPGRGRSEVELLSTFHGCDDTGGCITYSGKWETGIFQGAANDTITYTVQPGATARSTFTGTWVKYVYTKGYNRGFAAVAIDGVEKAIIDLYCPGVQWQQSTTFEGLAPGKHTIEIRALGRHSPAATDAAVDVDAIVTP